MDCLGSVAARLTVQHESSKLGAKVAERKQPRYEEGGREEEVDRL